MDGYYKVAPGHVLCRMLDQISEDQEGFLMPTNINNQWAEVEQLPDWSIGNIFRPSWLRPGMHVLLPTNKGVVFDGNYIVINQKAIQLAQT